MPAYLRDDDVAALKWVAGYPANKERGLPYITGLIVLNDPETGVPAAIMDGAEITAARTAAASGVCIRRFAPEDWSRAAVLGAGEQGRFHAQVLRELNPEVAIRAWDPHPERIGSLGDRVEGAPGPREAVEEADVVVTAGPIVEKPDSPLTSDWLAERSLGLPIDFDFYFSADAVASAELFLVDDVGQFDYYRSLGHFQGWPEPEGSVGEALSRDGSPGPRRLLQPRHRRSRRGVRGARPCRCPRPRHRHRAPALAADPLALGIAERLRGDLAGDPVAEDLDLDRLAGARRPRGQVGVGDRALDGVAVAAARDAARRSRRRRAPARSRARPSAGRRGRGRRAGARGSASRAPRARRGR